MMRRHATWDLPTQRDPRIVPFLLTLAKFYTKHTIRCCVRAGDLLGFPNSSVWSGGRDGARPSRCVPRFWPTRITRSASGPVVGAFCRPPMSKINQQLMPVMAQRRYDWRILDNSPPAISAAPENTHGTTCSRRTVHPLSATIPPLFPNGLP